MKRYSIKKYYLIFFIFLCSGCSNYVSSFAVKTQIKHEAYTYVSNAPLGFKFKTPGDLEFTKSKRKLRKHYSVSTFNPYFKILLVGKTIIPPHYQIILFESDSTLQSPIVKQQANTLVRDTLLNGKKISFVSIHDNNAKYSAKKDLQTIFTSLKLIE